MERKREYEVELRVYELEPDALDLDGQPNEINIYRQTTTLDPEESIYDVFVEQAHATDLEITQYEGGLEIDQAELLSD